MQAHNKAITSGTAKKVVRCSLCFMPPVNCGVIQENINKLSIVDVKGYDPLNVHC